MDNEDMSEIFKKLTSMINSSNNNFNDTSNDVSSDSNNFNEDTIKNIFNNFNSNNQENNQTTENNFNFDINTFLKMKNVIDKINSSKNDARSNLLLSLKPYLNNNRKEKLDQYIQFLNISKVIEAFNSDGGVNNK